MMTDREMLELAAKAAGIEHLSGEYYVSGPELWDIERKRWWRPLTNDGDAFRLMVALRLWRDDPDICCIERVEDHDGDAYAATRRAIVRVAAQIGAQM